MHFRVWFPFLVGAVVVLVCARLGLWQMDRAAYKEALQLQARQGAQSIAPSTATALQALPEWQRVSLSGEWLAAHTVLLDNRTHQQRAGFHVVTPLRLDGDGGVVLVNRGWIAGSGDYRRLPPVRTPPGRVAVSGMLRAAAGGYALGNAQARSGKVWQQIDIERYAKSIGEPLPQWLVQQENAADDGLVREWRAPDFGLHKHYGYAFQWFGLAATALVLMLWFGAKRMFVGKMERH